MVQDQNLCLTYGAVTVVTECSKASNLDNSGLILSMQLPFALCNKVSITSRRTAAVDNDRKRWRLTRWKQTYL